MQNKTTRRERPSEGGNDSVETTPTKLGNESVLKRSSRSPLGRGGRYDRSRESRGSSPSQAIKIKENFMGKRSMNGNSMNSSLYKQ